MIELKDKNIIFLGAPGVGKGTIASHLKEKYKIQHISTGEIFRKEIAKQSNLGKKIESIIASGNYVPDDITNQIVKNKLLSIKNKSFILDGYPRTINQAQFLDNQNIKIDYVILLEASFETIEKRLFNRQRADDNKEIIMKRNQVYNIKTQPLINYYEKQKKFFTVNVEGSLQKNIEELYKEIEKFNKN